MCGTIQARLRPGFFSGSGVAESRAALIGHQTNGLRDNPTSCSTWVRSPRSPSSSADHQDHADDRGPGRRDVPQSEYRERSVLSVQRLRPQQATHPEDQQPAHRQRQCDSVAPSQVDEEVPPPPEDPSLKRVSRDPGDNPEPAKQLNRSVLLGEAYACTRGRCARAWSYVWRPICPPYP